MWKNDFKCCYLHKQQWLRNYFYLKDICWSICMLGRCAPKDRVSGREPVASFKSKNWFKIVDLRFVQMSAYINPFRTMVLFLYPLKTSENLCFSDVFGGYRNRPVAWNWLKISQGVSLLVISLYWKNLRLTMKMW